MAIVAADWKVTRSTKIIDYIGTDHGVAAASYATVIELHRWLGDLSDDNTSSGDDQLDKTDILPSSRATDNQITLIGGYTITDTAIEHLYDGSIIQGVVGVDQKIWDGIVNYGTEGISIQVHQNGSVYADDYWNSIPDGETVPGINRDVSQGISHRFLIKVHDFVADSGDIDGRRLIGTTRKYLYTFGEFSINGTARGNNVLALVEGLDGNNATAIGTIAALTDIFIDRTISTTTVSGVNNTGQAILNVVDGAQFAAGGFILIAGDDAEYQILSIATNALTLNHNLDVATAGAEALYDLNVGFTQIDVNNNTTNEDYYAQWDKGANTINVFTERMKWLSRDGTGEYIYGISGELFRGITHEIVVDTPTGTFASVEDVSWSGGTGQMLAINSPTAGTIMWIQLLTGIAPTNNQVITGGISAGTVTMNVTITDRVPTIKTPFFGASTGTSIDGAYGFTLQTADLSNTDKVKDLTNTTINPPNNVQFDVGGVVVSEDNILVGNWDGTSTDASSNQLLGLTDYTLSTALTADNITAVVISETIDSWLTASGYIQVTDDNCVQRKLHYSSFTASTFTIDTTTGDEDFAGVNASSGVAVTYSQLQLDTALSADNIVSVVIDNSIPSDTPAVGYIRVADDNGFLRRLSYSSFTGSTFTIDSTDGQEDFLSVAASLGNDVYIGYLDLVATATTESFNYVYGAADRQFVIKVRDGGGTPIKEYIATGTMTSNGGSSTAIRTTDE